VKILYCGGGTGGHLIPLYSVFKKAEKKGHKALFVGSSNGFDAGFFARYNLPSILLSGSRFYQGGPLGIIKKLYPAIIESLRAIRAYAPDVVVASGGYGSVPVLTAALLCGIPYYLIEPNSVAGKVNRWFFPLSQKLFSHFESVSGLPAGSAKIISTGNPLPYESYKREGIAGLLVFGASQGASCINDFFYRYIMEKGAECNVYWVTGERDFPRFRHLAYRFKKLSVFPYADDMSKLYQKVSLALGRAGAGTVAEIEAFRLPCVFVPYAHHKDSQQFKNCFHLVEREACLQWEESSLNDGARINQLHDLLFNSSKRENMERRFPMRQITGAADNILTILESSF
jgi:UDP-N-acetylglucosamine--N-acetylmuramyl-(pentapeptide) pyrophosphoryl-undecaprenol N-acetylglucosamine transferase